MLLMFALMLGVFMYFHVYNGVDLVFLREFVRLVGLLIFL
jgi:hypothetical protein